jgi:hypothetical protein
MQGQSKTSYGGEGCTFWVGWGLGPQVKQSERCDSRQCPCNSCAPVRSEFVVAAEAPSERANEGKEAGSLRDGNRSGRSKENVRSFSWLPTQGLRERHKQNPQAARLRERRIFQVDCICMRSPDTQSAKSIEV